MVSTDHEDSGPPSPPPSAGTSGQFRAMLPSTPEVPEDPALELSRRPVEMARRFLRAERIAEGTRAVVGKPASTGPDGKDVPATGLWAVLEPIREMAEDWKLEKAAKAEAAKHGRSWIAERGTKLIDGFLPAIIVAALALIARHFHW